MAETGGTIIEARSQRRRMCWEHSSESGAPAHYVDHQRRESMHCNSCETIQRVKHQTVAPRHDCEGHRARGEREKDLEEQAALWIQVNVKHLRGGAESAKIQAVAA
jgi:hypothetical protein